MHLLVKQTPHPRQKDEVVEEVMGYHYCCKEIRVLFEDGYHDPSGRKPLEVHANHLGPGNKKTLKLHRNEMVFCPYCGAHTKTIINYDLEKVQCS